MDGRGRVAQSLTGAEPEAIRVEPRRAPVVSTSRALVPVRVRPASGRLDRWIERQAFLIKYCRLTRGGGVFLSLLIILGAIAYGVVKGDHVDSVVGAWQDTRDALANVVGFRVTEVALSGNKHLNREEVLGRAGVTGNTALVFFDVGAARARRLSHQTGDLRVRYRGAALALGHLDQLPAPRDVVDRVVADASVGEHEPAYAVAVPSPQRERHVAAHRKAAHHRSLDLQHVEYSSDVVRVAIHRVRRGRRRIAEAAHVDRDAAALGDECPDLRVPHGPVERERVQENDGQSRPDVVVRDAGVVDERYHSGSGHCGNNARHESGTGTGSPC